MWLLNWAYDTGEGCKSERLDQVKHLSNLLLLPGLGILLSKYREIYFSRYTLSASGWLPHRYILSGGRVSLVFNSCWWEFLSIEFAELFLKDKQAFVIKRTIKLHAVWENHLLFLFFKVVSDNSCIMRSDAGLLSIQFVNASCKFL